MIHNKIKLLNKVLTINNKYNIVINLKDILFLRFIYNYIFINLFLFKNKLEKFFSLIIKFIF